MSRWTLDTHTFVRRPSRWGLALAPRDGHAAVQAERRWRWPVLIALLVTIPAFYAEMLQATPSRWASAAYLAGALAVLAALLHVASLTRGPFDHVMANRTDVILAVGLVGAALLPPSQSWPLALDFRLLVAFLTLLRMVWSLQHLITRGGLAYMLLVALGVLGACGLGFWWLEPSAHTFADGVWLAFTTAATVGYGDLVPTTQASKIFSVFVVLLGYGVLSLVTAAIATSWVETEERRIEVEILHDVRREVASVRHELAALRRELGRPQADAPRAPAAPETPPPG